jgi:hypothetical protein
LHWIFIARSLGFCALFSLLCSLSLLCLPREREGGEGRWKEDDGRGERGYGDACGSGWGWGEVISWWALFNQWSSSG